MLSETDRGRLFANIAVRGPDECWLWTASRNGNASGDGYGQIMIAGKMKKAHRLVLEMALGRALNRGAFACHHCDNPPCCNPAHLFEGTPRQNVEDAVGKNRHARGEATPMHRLTEEAVNRVWEMALSGRFMQTEIAGVFGVHSVTISDVLCGRTWKHLHRGVDGRKTCKPRPPESYARGEIIAGKQRGEQHWTKRRADAHERICHGDRSRAARAHLDMRGEHNPAARLTEAQVSEIRQEWERGVRPQRILAERYGVSITQVSDIVRRRIWKHVEDGAAR